MLIGEGQPVLYCQKYRERETLEMQATLERLRERRESGDEGGFTLIELLIVIVILGILAAIVVFAVQNLTSQSAKASCGSDYKTVETALEAYDAQVGHYPLLGNAAAASPPPSAVPGDNWSTTPGGANGAAFGATDGIEMLYVQQAGSNGTNVGPWLKDAPKNGNLYQITVPFNSADSQSVANTASNGSILVKNLSTNATGATCAEAGL